MKVKQFPSRDSLDGTEARDVYIGKQRFRLLGSKRANHPTSVYYAPRHSSSKGLNAASGEESGSKTSDGNTLTGAGRTFAWTVDNRVESVTMGGTTTMDYDYTGQRVKKYGPLGLVLYPFAGYEIGLDGTKTKFFRLVTGIVVGILTWNPAAPFLSGMLGGLAAAAVNTAINGGNWARRLGHINGESVVWTSSRFRAVGNERSPRCWR